MNRIEYPRENSMKDVIDIWEEIGVMEVSGEFWAPCLIMNKAYRLLSFFSFRCGIGLLRFPDLETEAKADNGCNT